MTAFRPISPDAAIQILADANVGGDRQRLLANLAMAGVVRGYARLIETEGPAGAWAEIRDGRIDRSIWRRIVGEDRIADVYDVGAVHLGELEQANRTSVIGIRFDSGSVAGAAAAHGLVTGTADAAAITKEVAPARLTVPTAPAPAAHGREPVEERLKLNIEPRRAVLEPGTVALSVAETASVLGVSLGTVNNLIRRGELTVNKIGRRTLVHADSVRRVAGDLSCYPFLDHLAGRHPAS